MDLTFVMLNILMMPGIVAHEFGHKLFCDMFGVKVHKVCYFSFKDPPGFVVHEQPKSFVQTFFITVGPFIFNTLLAVLLAIFSLQQPIPIMILLAWLSVSVAMQSFPSKGDARSLWAETKRHMRNNILSIVGFPISGLIMLINIFRSFWFDLAYGLGIYLAVVFLL
jgi:hypothetical protein